MHELGITRNIIAIVSERANNRRVLRVQLSVGRLSAILADAISFCFDICSKNTVAEGASLEICYIDGRLKCRSCGTEKASNTLYGQCVCGSSDMQCIAGEELLISEIELE